MRRVVVALSVIACGSAKEPPKPEPAAVTRDAPLADASAPVDAVDVVAWLDALQPKGAPPPPLIRKHKRGDCSTKYAPRPDRDPNPMCRVKGGTFMMGGHLDASLHPAISSADPAVKVTVGDFDIDQFEVTARQAAHFLNAHGNDCDGRPCTLLDENSEIVEREGQFAAREGRELEGAIFERSGALRYCAWVGKEVPTSAEHEYAARHDPRTGRDLVYPWGDRWSSRHASCGAEICDTGEQSAGLHDGTRGRGDGSSPWGAHDMIDKMGEHVYACAEPSMRCTFPQVCTCQWLSSTAGQDEPLAHATFARVKVSGSAVRCVARR